MQRNVHFRSRAKFVSYHTSYDSNINDNCRVVYASGLGTSSLVFIQTVRVNIQVCGRSVVRPTREGVITRNFISISINEGEASTPLFYQTFYNAGGHHGGGCSRWSKTLGASAALSHWRLLSLYLSPPSAAPLPAQSPASSGAPAEDPDSQVSPTPQPPWQHALFATTGRVE